MLIPSTSHIARFLWARLLAFVFFIAFLSLLLQAPALMGSEGLLPVKNMLLEAARLLPETWKRFWMFPTLCWFSPSDNFLILQCVLGLLASAAAFLGLAPGFLMALCWALYLSLTQAGQEFFRWPFDSLLLECGLLAAFVLPWRLTWFRPDPTQEPPPSVWEKTLALTLLFKCFFLPGLGHLVQGDPSWATLVALPFQTLTQPLPTGFGLLVAKLPPGLSKALTATLLVLELAVPILLLFSTKLRRIAFYPLALLAIASAWTGDSVWTGVLLLGLCLWALDDASFPAALGSRFLGPSTPDISLASRTNWFGKGSLAIYSLVFAITLLGFFFGLLGFQPFGSLGNKLYRAVYPLQSFNSYLPTETIPTRRLELTVEGTADGLVWKPYAFPSKPADPLTRPATSRWSILRLDVQMSLAARKDCQSSPFLAQLCSSLLTGNKRVLGLLSENPFPDKPPLAVRVQKQEIRFSNARERREGNGFWIREAGTDFCPEIRLPK
jgi:hypothetical protein